MSETLTAFATDLEARARAAESLAELGFTIANDAHAALHFRQALVLAAPDTVLTVSGLAQLSEDSPYLLWLGRAWPWVAAQLPAEGGWFAPPAELLAGTLTETSYQAGIAPDGVASYLLRASVDDQAARIGLRGTAKLYGEWVVLGYYLLRRPLAKLREWSGW